MYIIYADGSPIYIPGVDSKERERYTVTSPTLTLELNKAGNLEFIMMPGNAAYNALRKLRTVVQVFRGDVEIWRGRVLHIERNFWNQKAVYCEGELAFLCDYQQRPFEYKGSLEGYFRMLLENYNAAVDDWKQFQPGKVTVTDSNDYLYRYKDTNASTWELLNEQLLDTHGGYLKVRVEDGIRYLDYLAEPGGVSSQTVMFGENLLDFNEYITAEDVYTVIVPQGAQDGETGERLSIAEVNGGKDYLVSDAGAALFGHIEKTVQWDDVTDASNLLAKAKATLAAAVEMAANLTISAVDLHHVDVNTEALRLGDYVPCVSIPHDLNSNFLLSRMEIPLDTPGGETYTLGVVLTGLTDTIISGARTASSAAASASSAVVAAKTASSEANAASEEVGKVVASLPTDYVKSADFNAYKQTVDKRFSEEVPKKVSTLENDAGYLTGEQASKDYVAADDFDAYKQAMDQRFAEEVPTKVSALENDAGYLTETRAAERYAAIDDFNDLVQRVSNLEGGSGNG